MSVHYLKKETNCTITELGQHMRENSDTHFESPISHSSSSLSNTSFLLAMITPGSIRSLGRGRRGRRRRMWKKGGNGKERRNKSAVIP